ncbi:MAG: leucine-rich repeat domain-containing protein [Clostridia bacterium]|nr:leucine-rich repeat domain-containing protein [Clostridia bacterium]
MKAFKALRTLFLICFALLCCIALSGCNVNEEPEYVVGNKIICRSSDFERVKGDWYGDNELVSDSALAVSADNIVVGESYYLVVPFIDNTKYGVDCNIKVTLKNENGFSNGNNAVELDGTKAIFDGNRYVNKIISSTFSIGASKNADEPDGIRASYFAIPFVPKEAGLLCINASIETSNSEYVLSDNEPITYVNVNREENATGANTTGVSVSDLAYGLVGPDIYLNGLPDNISSIVKIPQMSKGENYVVVDFVIENHSNEEKEISCGIYLYKSGLEKISVQEVNTSSFFEKSIDGDTLLGFTYGLNKNEKKKARIVLSVIAPDLGSVNMEMYMYSGNTPITGAENVRESYVDASATTLKYSTEAGKSYIVGYNMPMTGTVIIPKFCGGYPVDAIYEDAFSGCTELVTLKTNGISYISSKAFSNCTGLETVIFDDSMEKIAIGAFKGCSSLRNVELAQSITGIGSEAFMNCANLTEMRIPASVTLIGSRAFEGCSSLKMVYFENGYPWEVIRYGESIIVEMDSPTMAAKNLTGYYANDDLNYRSYYPNN